MAGEIQKFHNDVNAAFDKVGTAVDGVSADVAALKKQIADLQTTPGQITPEDQALLDAIQARANSIAEKLAALDQLTEAPPAPPTPPPV